MPIVTTGAGRLEDYKMVDNSSVKSYPGKLAFMFCSKANKNKRSNKWVYLHNVRTLGREVAG